MRLAWSRVLRDFMIRTMDASKLNLRLSNTLLGTLDVEEEEEEEEEESSVMAEEDEELASATCAFAC